MTCRLLILLQLLTTCLTYKAVAEEFMLPIVAYSGLDNKIQTDARLRISGKSFGIPLTSFSTSGDIQPVDKAFISLMESLASGNKAHLMSMIDTERMNGQDPLSVKRLVDFLVEQKDMFRIESIMIDYRLHGSDSTYYLIHSHDGILDGLVYALVENNGRFFWDASPSYLPGVIQSSFGRNVDFRIPRVSEIRGAAQGGYAILPHRDHTNDAPVLFFDLIQLDGKTSSTFPSEKREKLLEAFLIFESDLPAKDFDDFISRFVPEYRGQLALQRDNYWSMNEHWHRPVEIRCIAGLDPLYIVWYTFPGGSRLFNRQFVFDDIENRFLITNVNYSFTLLSLLEQGLVENRFRFANDDERCQGQPLNNN